MRDRKDRQQFLEFFSVRGLLSTSQTRLNLSNSFPRIVAERSDFDGRLQLACLYEHGVQDEPFREGKWRVAWSVYPYKLYPEYCRGGMYVASMRTVALLWEASRTAPVLAFDDVWITGILRHRAGIPVSEVVNWSDVAEHFGPMVPDETVDRMDLRWRKLWERTTINKRNKHCRRAL